MSLTCRPRTHPRYSTVHWSTEEGAVSSSWYIVTLFSAVATVQRKADIGSDRTDQAQLEFTIYDFISFLNLEIFFTFQHPDFPGRQLKLTPVNQTRNLA